MQRILFSRWSITAAGTVLLAALVWVFVPFLSSLQDPLPRAVAVVGLLAIWGVANLLIDLRRRRRDRALAEGVAKADPSADASLEEAEAVQEKLSQAMTLLRQARGSRGWLYEQPWYVVIGPVGAGISL